MAVYRRGSDDYPVAAIQSILNSIAPPGAIKLVTDCKYGSNTERRVREFQQRAGLKIDGIYGPNTDAKLMAASKGHWDSVAAKNNANGAAAGGVGAKAAEVEANPDGSKPLPDASGELNDETLPPFTQADWPRLKTALSNAKRGDFFLLASGTGANVTIRDWSHTRYGHAVFFAQDMLQRRLTTESGATITIPKQAPKGFAAIELPLNCEMLPYILHKDKTFRICHVSPKHISRSDGDKLLEIILAFYAAKYVEGDDTAGYSDNSAIYYAIADTLHGQWDKYIGFANVFSIGRNSPKAFNALLQSVVELYGGYPNLNCSALISWAYKEIGKPITFFSNTTSPRDLYEEVVASSQFEVREYSFA